ncbi:DUF456 domain-containing protein [Brevibacillus ginsengisoli]|uniref:DUF456 domain-containing protein n=1 Tax=Brevibacillus ginsengisoli TaxID=363854 RepID=UPI003CF892A1
MADEKNAQLNADKKEVTTPQPFQSYLDDTEFGADTWMGAVMNPDASRSNTNMMHNPGKKTDEYLGPQATWSHTDLPATQANNSQNNANRSNDISNLTKYEMGAEAGALPRMDTRRNESKSPVTGPNQARGDAAGGLGMVGLGLSLLSLFMLPYLLAPIGIVLGYLAMRRNATTLGTWAMIVGAIAILGALIVYPYFIAR